MANDLLDTATADLFGAEADCASLHPFGDVPDVPGVPPNNGAGSSGTAGGTADVPDVPALAELIEAATAGEGGDTEETVVPSVPEDDRPCFKVYDDWTRLDTGRKLRPGVWLHGMSKPKKEEMPVPVDTWVCGPLHIEAQTFDGGENNFGRLLRFKNTAGRWRSWAMPMELLKGDGSDLRGELLAMGLELDPFARQTLARYLQERTPKKRIRCALQVGWCGGVFVLPDAVIGPGADGVIFQSGERSHDEHGQAGTLDGWQREIAARAVGNPLFLLALSAAFAGPLLKRTNTEGGGLHFVGDSSTGKTTILEAACSVWGGPGYRRSWRATANGMEGAAALFNDCLLALDEISECDPREVGAIVYALGNGRGKQRASRSGAARSVTRWQAFIVSTGERTITTTMQEGGQRTKAGQAVRLLDIPAARQFGCFDELHGMASGTALSDAIKRAAAHQHGRAGRAYLERLAHDERDMAALLERIKALPAFNPPDAEGQDKRAASRFALLALAGELATEYGITGWPEQAALDAAVIGFQAWRSMRGGGNDERRQILDKLAGFLERHGDSRFSDWTDGNATIRDRAGWWKPDDAGGRLYLFNADGLREALKGFDFKRALDVLESCGVIPKASATGERSKTETIGGRKVRVYSVRADALHGVGNGA
jgi:putative DNA primase/helicase